MGGINGKVHASADARGRLMRFHLTAAQNSDCEGAEVLLKNLRSAKMLVTYRANDADKIRHWLKEGEMDACIRPRSNRKKINCDQKICGTRYRIENALGRMKD